MARIQVFKMENWVKKFPPSHKPENFANRLFHQNKKIPFGSFAQNPGALQTGFQFFPRFLQFLIMTFGNFPVFVKDFT